MAVPQLAKIQSADEVLNRVQDQLVRVVNPALRLVAEMDPANYPALVGRYDDEADQAGKVGPVALHTPAQDGFFQLHVAVEVSAAAGLTSQVSAAWTDSYGHPETAAWALGSGAWAGPGLHSRVLDVYAMAGKPISFAHDILAGSATYRAHARLLRIG